VELFAGGKFRIPAGSIQNLMRDGNARVRLQALLAWNRALGASSLPKLIAQFPALNDEYMRAVVLSIAVKHPVAAQKAAFRARSSEKLVALLSAVATRVARTGSGRNMLEMLLTMAAGQEAPELQSSVLLALQSGSRERDKPWPSPRLSRVLRRLGDSDDLQVSLATLPLARAWAGDQIANSNYSTWTQGALDALEGTRASVHERVLAAHALLASPEDRSRGITFSGLLLGLELSARQQMLLLEELAIGDEQVSGSLLVRCLPNLAPAALQLAQRELMIKLEWIELLLAALESGALPPASVGPAWRAELMAYGDPSVQARAKKLFSN
jgi:hypothetical protein